LPVTQHAYDVTMRIQPSTTLANGWRIHGKTGAASAALPDGSRDAQHRLQPHGAAGQGKRQCRGRVKQAMPRELGARLDTLQAATSGDTSPTAGTLQLNRRAFDRPV
jgi:bla regulator protein blaR1